MKFNFLKNMDKELKTGIIMIIATLSTLSSIFGATVGHSTGCEYTTVFTRINVPYIIGCELFKVRFEPNAYLK